MIALRLARNVGYLTGNMVEPLQAVEDGNLDTRLEVVSADEFALLYRGFNRMAAGLKESQRLYDAFGRYVSPQLAEQVRREGVRLGGTSVHATVLFADI